MITVHVNSIKKEIEAELSLSQFLHQLQQSGDGIAVAINQEVITKNNWNKTRLTAGDDILIIQATQGG